MALFGRSGSAFDDRVCIVTGAASGIGRAIALGLAERGARVVVADIRQPDAVDVAAEIESQGGTARAVRVDVADAASVERLVNETVASDGRLDIMVNNAGIAIAGAMQRLELEHWRRVVDVNLWGVVYGTHFAFRHMARQGSGHIVNVASGYGLVPTPYAAPYACSKFAVVGLSESLRPEAAHVGVHVTVACPGYVDTPLLERSEGIGVRLSDMLSSLPFARLKPEACAAAILRGVAKQQPMVVFPGYVRALVLMYRSFPSLFDRVSQRTVRSFERVRLD
jgi:NAD(P)-dependent dehydrogenase (short-subunit alcohol dehydrogenase family)